VSIAKGKVFSAYDVMQLCSCEGNADMSLCSGARIVRCILHNASVKHSRKKCIASFRVSFVLIAITINLLFKVNVSDLSSGK